MNETNQEATRRTVERVARESYGRLVAYLSVHTHDLAGSEDALSNALVSALKHWPQEGVPQNPEGWLMTAARRSVIDVIRHERVALASEPTLKLLQQDSTETITGTEFPDERLKLLFVCAHPAIDPTMHTPLMLQTVLGLDAARIAQAFLVAPKTIGQRLFRAKTKVRSGGIPLFLSFCTATAFSPAEAQPLTSRGMLLLMLESVISLVTVIAVAARAINILGG